MKQLAASIATAVSLLSSVAAAAAAPATTFLFSSSGEGVQPLGAVRAGVFAPLQRDGDDLEAARLRYRFGAKEERLSVRALKLFGYRDGNLRGTWNARGLAAGQMDGATLVDIPEYDTRTARLLASTPLGSAGPAPAATPADLRAGRALLQAQLARRGVPRKAWKDVLAALQVRTVLIAENAAPVLVVTATAPVDPAPGAQARESERAFSTFLIAEKRNERWTPAFQASFFGNALCGVTGWAYLDHADLDGDGSDEIVVDAWGDETTHPATILKRGANGRWQASAAGALPDARDCR